MTCLFIYSVVAGYLASSHASHPRTISVEPKKLILDALADKGWAAEDLPSEVTSWDESVLFTPAFEKIKICPALLALHCSLPYSIPDIVRMNNFVSRTAITCEKSFSEDTYHVNDDMMDM